MHPTAASAGPSPPSGPASAVARAGAHAMPATSTPRSHAFTRPRAPAANSSVENAATHGVAPVNPKITRARPSARIGIVVETNARKPAPAAHRKNAIAVGRRPHLSMARPLTKKPLPPSAHITKYCGRICDSFRCQSSLMREDASVATAAGNSVNRKTSAVSAVSDRRGSADRRIIATVPSGAVSGIHRRTAGTSSSGTIPATKRIRQLAPVASTTRYPAPATAVPKAVIEVSSPRARPRRSGSVVSTRTIVASANCAPRNARDTNWNAVNSNTPCENAVANVARADPATAAMNTGRRPNRSAIASSAKEPSDPAKTTARTTPAPDSDRWRDRRITGSAIGRANVP